MENNKGFVYGLVCPLTKEIKYIGQTRRSPSYRLSGILTKYKNKKLRKNSKKNLWLENLEKLSLHDKIEHFIIEECGIQELGERENFWIMYFNFIGADLVNLAEGGFEPRGWKIPKGENHFQDKKHSEESLKIMSEKAKLRTGEKNHFYRKTHTEEAKEKIRSKSKSQKRVYREIILIDEKSKEIVDRCESIYSYIEKYSPPYKWRTIYSKIKTGTPINGLILKNN